MLRRAALQEHEARGHGDGDEGALGAVAGVEEEDHGAAAVAGRCGRRPRRRRDAFLGARAVLAALRSPLWLVLSAVVRATAASQRIFFTPPWS